MKRYCTCVRSRVISDYHPSHVWHTEHMECIVEDGSLPSQVRRFDLLYSGARRHRREDGLISGRVIANQNASAAQMSELPTTRQ